MTKRKRPAQLWCTPEEKIQFQLIQKQSEMNELTTRRQVNKNLKQSFLDVTQQNYMDDQTNLFDIKLFGRRVLVIGDLHAPFILNGYLEHCKEIYKQWACNTVVFIGDVIDNHYASYHETNPNGMGGKEELDRAIEKLSPWNKAFPNAYVTIGNHDRIIMRKATTSNVPRQWIRTYKEVLKTPNWVFTESLEIDDVMYIHGEGGTAKTKAKNDLQSVVQGHLHSQCYIEFLVGNKRKVFGMQVGCGIDKTSYAMAYGKNFRKPIISCGVVIEGNPYIEMMNL